MMVMTAPTAASGPSAPPPAQGVVFNAKSAVALVNERRIEFVRARNVRVIGKVDALATGSGGAAAAQQQQLKKRVLVEREDVERLLAWTHSRKIGPGFANLGNTCYLNSVLQCLSYTPSFAQFLLQKDVLAAFAAGASSSGGAAAARVFPKLHAGDPAKGANAFCGVRAMCRLLQSVHGGGSGRVLQPKEIVMNVRHVSKSFRIGRQEDAHEFFRLLLDAMQRACLRKAHIKAETHPAAATTLVHRVFGGTLRNTLKCAKCAFVSERFDDFLDLSLEVNHGITSVKSALQHFTAVETLDDSNAWKCARCKQPSRAEKGMAIETGPSVLVLQLKRFDAMFGKIKKHVEFAATLDLAPRMAAGSADRARGRCKYALHAVLVHAGYSTDCGHYYAFVKGSSGQWYEMNDESVRWVSLDTVLQQKAYMLFYSRVLPAAERPPPKPKASASAASAATGAEADTAPGTKRAAEEIPEKVAAAPKARELDMNGFLSSLKTNITSARDAESGAADVDAEVEEAKGAKTRAMPAAAALRRNVVVTFSVTAKRRAPGSTLQRAAASMPTFGGRVGKLHRFSAAMWRPRAESLEMEREVVETAADEAEAHAPAKKPVLTTVEDIVAATTAAAPLALPTVTKVHFDPRQLKNIGVKSAALFGKSVDKWSEANGESEEKKPEGGDDAPGVPDLERELAAKHDRVMNKLKSEDWKHRNAGRQDYWDETLDTGKLKKVKKRKEFVTNQGTANKFQLKLQQHQRHKKPRHQ
ncbi:hypothetical protein PybrP1_008591 [[Pythium] brassicae (nom. inval.)]|nr:hypothetical protein PybrP1_008591 [[Pythium] brassicae (nom. inval.)]